MGSLRKPRASTYDDYLALPEEQKAELVDGEIYLMSPAPKGRHIRVTSLLGSMLGTRFGLRGEASSDGPGGWWILDEPEVHLRLDRRVVRPDMAGWRRERMPNPPSDSHKFTLVPDWICEVLSPSTLRWDMLVKMPRYLEHGVHWVWLIDPVERRIDVLEAVDGEWVTNTSVEGSVRARLPPFDAAELDLEPVWGP